MKINSEKEKLAILKINSTGSLQTLWCTKLLEYTQTAAGLLLLNAKDISSAIGIKEDNAKRFLDQANAFDAEEEMENAQKIGAHIIFIDDDNYPELLKETPFAPYVLYVRGDSDFSKSSLGFVGARKPSFYGKRVAERLAQEACDAGYIITSGLARGIDGIMHTIAVKNKKPTWAVIGTGLDLYYPSEHKKLTEAIVDGGGKIITEFPFFNEVKPYHFPLRNRIIAGLCAAVCVIEATQISGSLTTARYALDCGRDVFAVPGQVDNELSKGTNNLIRNGAGLTRNIDDITDLLSERFTEGIARVSQSEDKPLLKCNEEESMVLGFLTEEGLTLDQIVEKTGWSVPRVSGLVFEMELKNLVVNDAGIYYKK